ncbi:MAG: magnesium-translocating P-type ATPase [Planctomycetia bacterium]
MSAQPAWSREPGALLDEQGSGPGGLEAGEAQRRLAVHGANRVEDVARRGPWRLLGEQLASPLVLILLFAAGVSLWLREWVDASIVLAIVAGSGLLGWWQQLRAGHAVEALAQRLALLSRVVRDGREQVVAAATLVPGDVVLLSAGNLVPADGCVLEARDFLVSEASLTGESFPVEKHPGVLPPGTPLPARTNCVWMGASVRSGTARVLVLATGRATAFGGIVARLRTRPPAGAFARGLHQFGDLLLRVMLALVRGVLALHLLLGRPWADSLLFALALAVGLSPELLPAIVSVTLASGARRLGREGVIVRRPEALEDLGSMDVLCTDKTGTLTEGRVVLYEALDTGGQPSAAVARLAALNARLETGIENPLDAAIVEAAQRRGISTEGVVKVDEIPYDFQRRRLTVVVAGEGSPGEHLLVTKGAFGSVLAACERVAVAGGEQPLDGEARARLAARAQAAGEAGMRVLGLCTRRAPARAAWQREDEAGMRFEGFLLFLDPPRADAPRMVQDLAGLGVQVKVVTGDNRHVTQHVARAVGLDAGALVTGAEVAALPDEALWQVAQRSVLFVEIDPQQKERIVRALQRTGHAVGYLGDGINDAPALHAADVGISVDQAVDVARESADIVLLERNLDVLRDGVLGGRRTLANTLTYVAITTSANFGNMVSMALAAPLLPFLPLLATQILLNNFLSDLPALALAGDRADPTRLQRPQRWSLPEVRRFMLAFGLLSSVFDLLAFALLLWVLRVEAATFQTAWFVISLLTELGVVLVLRTRGAAWRSRPSPLLLGTTLAAAAAALLLPFAGPLAAAFGFVPLALAQLGAVLATVAAYLAATELAKRRFYRVPAAP